MTELTKDEAYVLAEFIDMNFFEFLRNNVDVDSMQWLKNMIHAYEKLCKFSGFVGLTESGADDE